MFGKKKKPAKSTKGSKGSGKVAISGPTNVVKVVHVDRDLNWQFDSCEDPHRFFKVVKQIGKGGFGVVYQIEHVDSNQLFAGKVIIPAFLNDNAREELEHEVKLMRAIRSVYTVSYYGTMPFEGSLMILMEFCDRGSIRDIMLSREKVLTEEQIAIVMSDVLHGIEVIHKKQIVHRDIKAANILLNREGDVKIADFGVSRKFEAGSQHTMTVVGSPYWMAPEVIQGHAYSYPADIWAIGITAVELAEGSPPFMEYVASRAMVEISTKGFPGYRFPDKHSELFKQFVARCVKMNPSERATPAQLLTDPFLANVPKYSKKDVLAELVVQHNEQSSGDSSANRKSTAEPPTPDDGHAHSGSDAGASEGSFLSNDVTFVSSNPSGDDATFVAGSFGDATFVASPEGDATFVAAPSNGDATFVACPDGADATFVACPDGNDATFVATSSSVGTASPPGSPTSALPQGLNNLEKDLEAERKRREALEQEVTRLSHICEELLAKVEDLTRVVQSEQLYRRGCEYMYGTNGYRERSTHLGLSVIKESAELGNTDAQYVYSRCLSEGTSGKTDIVEAVKYLKLSAEQHNSYAEAKYGLALHSGQGVEQDRSKAIEYLQKAASVENSLGEALFGKVLENGEGIEKQPHRAVELFMLSASQGNPNGSYFYAQALENGRGVQKDVRAAAELYKELASQGYHNAVVDYERCTRGLTG